ncbi:hypothetical protein Cal7507_2163 [Calothrix sp. PCC 7507]|nr:hypothetical protein Cal7507_2163 [Calothrix sp. PCC 7507]
MVKSAVKPPNLMPVMTMTSDLLWVTIIEALYIPLYQQEFTLHPRVSVRSVQMLKS